MFLAAGTTTFWIFPAARGRQPIGTNDETRMIDLPDHFGSFSPVTRRSPQPMSRPVRSASSRRCWLGRAASVALRLMAAQRCRAGRRPPQRLVSVNRTNSWSRMAIRLASALARGPLSRFGCRSHSPTELFVYQSINRSGVAPKEKRRKKSNVGHHSISMRRVRRDALTSSCHATAAGCLSRMRAKGEK
jgi:hypothetical protein